MLHVRPARSAGVSCVAVTVAVAMTLAGCSTTQPGSGSPAATTAASSASSAAAARRPASPTVPPGTTAVASTSGTSHRRHDAARPGSGRSSTRAPAPTRTSPPDAANTYRSLPVDEPAHGAGQVITVVAPSTHSTTAVLQRWTRVAGGGWHKVGASVPADLGTDGMTRHPSESRSATPIGSFTLTHAFGHDSDPGTRLPYAHTTPDDWWISQPGPLYNTRQRCDSGCDFTQGDPNEHLWYETPAYDYAVVIDYNTRNAPGGVHQGAGSAFFLHVSEGKPTAGCVSIPVDRLLAVLSWLRPADHPRILIGTG